MRCLYVVCIMAMFWMTECVPLPVTAFIPIITLPVLGIQSTDEVTKEYMKGANVMFVGGLVVAIAIEHCNLHHRIALKMLLLVRGTSMCRINLSMMLTTCFLSMWISNTAAVSMMIPIIDAVCKANDEVKKKRKVLSNMTTEYNALMLAVAYAANIGGTGVITGTPPNLVVPNVLGNDKSKPTDNARVTYASWMGFAIPLMLINLVFAWGWIIFLSRRIDFGSRFEDCSQKGKLPTIQKLPSVVLSKDEDDSVSTEDEHKGKNPSSPKCVHIRIHDGLELDLDEVHNPQSTIREDLDIRDCESQLTDESQNKNEEQEDEEYDIMRIVQDQYDSLGSMSVHEWSVLIVFLLLILAWFFRAPRFSESFEGWGDVLQQVWALPEGGGAKTVDTAVPAMAAVLMLFILPTEYKFWPFQARDANPQSSPALLTWNVVEKKLPWGIIWFLGGGFALASAVKASTLSDFLTEHLKSVLEGYTVGQVNIFMSLLANLATQVMSNTATASIMLPILSDYSIKQCANPIFMVVTSAISCSYAFMLPVATAPNAMVFSCSSMKLLSMMKAGFIMNMFCLITTNLAINTSAIYFFDLNKFPNWAPGLLSNPLDAEKLGCFE